MLIMTLKINMNMQLFICSKSRCLHLHHYKWAHAPSILLRFKLLTSCCGPPPPSTWIEFLVCGDIGGRWRHEGVSKIGDAWSIGCLLISSLNHPNTIDVGVKRKGWVSIRGLYPQRWSLVFAQTGGAHADARLRLCRQEVCAQTELCILADRSLCLHRRVFSICW